MKKVLGLLLLLIAAGAIFLVITPSPIDPLAWDAPTAPTLTGVLEPNDTLMKAELVGKGKLHGPEDTAVDAQGRVYAGQADGTIVRIDSNDKVELFADTQGRPLGMDFDAQGNLIVADAYKGLLSIDPQGAIKVLTTEAEGLPFAFTDDLDIASDGTIYFSDASSRFEQPRLLARPAGSPPVGPPAELHAKLRQNPGAAQRPVFCQRRGPVGQRRLRTGKRDVSLPHHPLLAQGRQGRRARGVHRQPAGAAGQP
uniref:SMP-30/Gluconolactonase/LRE-like region domain-containing protein n=1 Tax=Pseudomonas marincola TaxID=437900 RepID=A0A653E9V6_9PSED